MTMSINTGLVSGMDTGALVSQLLQVEAAPQAALKAKLSAAKTTAAAYRTLNTSLQALMTSAETLGKAATWNSIKGTSSSPSVAITAGPTAAPGSLTFTVAQLATTASSVSADRWGTTTEATGITTLDIRVPGTTTSKGTIALDGTESLTQVVAAINASPLGLTAAAVQVSPGQFALQVSATKSGEDAGFELFANKSFTGTSAGQNAVLTVGTTGTYTVTSPSNVFEGILPGTTLTVNKKDDTPVTVSVVADPDAIAGKVSSLFDALNTALGEIRSTTNNTPGSKAVLRGEYAISSIGGRLLEAVSKAVAVDGTDHSPAEIGFQLTREGKVTFDKEKFAAALAKDPALAQRLLAGTPDNPGIAERLRTTAKEASDTTTGTLTSLAKGQDSMARDIENRITAWDVRLAKRKQTLTRQFTAMETALSSLQNQSNWLAGQLKSLG